MRKLIWQQKLMLACLAVLYLFMASIMVRCAVCNVLVKKLALDNAVTQTVLFDRPALQLPAMTQEKKKLDWSKIYPYNGEDKATANAEQAKPVSPYVARVLGVEKKINAWCTDHVIDYNFWSYWAATYAHLVRWNLTAPQDNNRALELEPGYYATLYPEGDVRPYAEAVRALQDVAADAGARLIYVQAPEKINKFHDVEIQQLDHANQNADRMLACLQELGVDTYDLRDELERDFTAAEYRDLFFRTDHHWRLSTGMWAAAKLTQKLHADYGIAADLSHFDLADYDEEVHSGLFIGSQGTKLTTAMVEPEDFSYYYPRFTTKIHWNTPSFGVDKVGDFSIVYNKDCLGLKRYGLTDVCIGAHSSYGYGGSSVIFAENLLLDSLPDQRILIIRDSFGNTTLPFMTLALKNIVSVWPLAYNGSIEGLIRATRPNVVVIMYTCMNLKDNDKIMFDFR